MATRAAEAPAFGESVFSVDRSGKVAAAYAALAKEVIADAPRERDTLQSAVCR